MRNHDETDSRRTQKTQISFRSSIEDLIVSIDEEIIETELSLRWHWTSMDPCEANEMTSLEAASRDHWMVDHLDRLMNAHSTIHLSLNADEKGGN